jgi:hypothetical protein
MFITNKDSSIFERAYKANKFIAKYLIYKCGIPALGMDERFYYFSKTIELDVAIKDMPLRYKLLNKILP